MIADVAAQGRERNAARIGCAVRLNLVFPARDQRIGLFEIGDRFVELAGGDVAMAAMAQDARILQGISCTPSLKMRMASRKSAGIGGAAAIPDQFVGIAGIGLVIGLGGPIFGQGLGRRRGRIERLTEKRSRLGQRPQPRRSSGQSPLRPEAASQTASGAVVDLMPGAFHPGYGVRRAKKRLAEIAILLTSLPAAGFQAAILMANTVRKCAAQQYYKRLPRRAGLAKNRNPLSVDPRQTERPDA